MENPIQKKQTTTSQTDQVIQEVHIKAGEQPNSVLDWRATITFQSYNFIIVVAWFSPVQLLLHCQEAVGALCPTYPPFICTVPCSLAQCPTFTLFHAHQRNVNTLSSSVQFHAHFGNEIKSIYQTDTHSFPKENNIAIDIHLPNPKNVTDKCDQLESQKTLNSPFQLSLYLQSITSTIILKFEAIRDGRGENVQELT